MCKKSIIEQVDDFMLSKSSNLWLEDNILTIFVRKSNRYINNQCVKTFDVANIHSIRPKDEHKGYFKAFMIKVESLGLPVYVESIENPLLAEMLEKNGYDVRYGQYDTNAIKFPS